MAMDIGLEAVEALDLEPDMIVGSFGTAKPEIPEYYGSRERIIRDTHQPKKGKTDTELILLKA